jgi:hypothetical protein
VNNGVTHGFAIAFPLNKIDRLKEVLIVPINIQAQNTIDEMGRIIPKDRLVHKQSYKWKSSDSTGSSRVRKEELLPCFYGGVAQ